MSDVTARLVVADPGVSPNTTGLPGLDVLREIGGALLTFGLVFSLIGLVVSAIVMAVGSVAKNGRMADMGKTGAMWSLVAAVIIGGANALITLFSAMGSRI
ncbi:hypothetical protein JL108_07285 [Aeromicrobium sp. YIM 150415]|uniref:DUF6112 family protein n=1 Tax=Aeromicrobium sp. YIM 150415 TaxID=2803912 RepID=UPI001965A395|nr:DUF6112 family protein [Aeromicrobium sp. YIM 150415]MBM9463248.1 hypothetical protein [Aeromicrobium sp. YIM 150415]